MMVKLKDLDFTAPHGFRLVIDNFNVAEGEVVAVIGPNGAGKTTLLNILALLQDADAGTLELLGDDAGHPARRLALRRAMSFVFSQPCLLNDTVHNNVRLPLKLRGERDDGRVDKALAQFRVAGLKDRNARALSQGERHRVSLARAFVTKPRLVLLDEPFSSLDARVKESVIQDLRGILKDSKTAAVLVTQDQSEALALAGSIAVIKDGRILQRAAPLEIFNRPASKDVADFVGVETILEGVVTGKSDNLCSITAGGGILEAVSGYERGDGVFVCVRPEVVSVSKSAETNSMRNHFKARITSIEPWRLEYRLNLDCGFNLAASVTKQSVEDLGLKTGDEVVASFKATAVHVIRR